MPVASQQQETSRRLPSSVHTAIIGGGVAGLYAAFRLTAEPKALIDRTVALFEASDRLGGRLCTARPEREEGPYVVDMGAMRYMRSQRLLTALVDNVLSPANPSIAVAVPFMNHSPQKKEHKQEQDCESNSLSVQEESAPPTMLFHLKGRTITLEEMRDEARSPHVDMYNLPACWRGLCPDRVLTAIILEVLQADGVSPENFRNRSSQSALDPHRVWASVKQNGVYRFDGPMKNRPLHELELRDVILDRADPETFSFLMDALGYGCNATWRAPDAFEVYSEEFVAEEPTLTLSGGMEAIATGLRDICAIQATRDMSENSVAEMFTGARLVSFERVQDGEFKYKLEIEDYGDNTACQKDRSFEVVTVFANNIVLALPPLSVETLTPSLLALPGLRHTSAERVRADVQSVSFAPAVKVALWFKTAWWADRYGQDMRVATDLPLRQSFLFGSREVGGLSVVIATYSDMESVDFWKGLQEGGCDYGGKLPVPSSRATPLEGCEERIHIDARNDEGRRGGLEDASPLVVEEVLRQLRAVFGEELGHAIEGPGMRPVKSIFKVWDGKREEDQMACHMWRKGVLSWECAKRMRRQSMEEEVFVCGEGYSDRHGWVEGALCTTELMLQEHFGMDEPSWFSSTGHGGECPDNQNAEYYLGW